MPVTGCTRRSEAIEAIEAATESLAVL